MYLVCVCVCVCLHASITTEKEEEIEVEALKEMEDEYSKTIRLVMLGHLL